MSERTMNIGAISKKSGISAGTIRYYESKGYLPPARRTPNGYRSYNTLDLDTLLFISSARSLGFPIEDVRELLAISRGEYQASKRSKARIEHYTKALARKIDDLNAMRKAILALVDFCQSDCRPDHPSLDNVTRRNAS